MTCAVEGGLKINEARIVPQRNPSLFWIVVEEHKILFNHKMIMHKIQPTQTFFSTKRTVRKIFRIIKCIKKGYIAMIYFKICIFSHFWIKTSHALTALLYFFLVETPSKCIHVRACVLWKMTWVEPYINRARGATSEELPYTTSLSSELNQTTNIPRSQ